MEAGSGSSAGERSFDATSMPHRCETIPRTNVPLAPTSTPPPVQDLQSNASWTQPNISLSEIFMQAIVCSEPVHPG